MTTIGESVSRVRNVFKGVVEDAFITDRFIYTLILKYAKALIRRQDNESKLMQYDSLFETIPYIELIEVDTIEADCAGVKTGCKIMRTKKQLPQAFHGSMGPLYRSISPIDGSDTLQQITPGIYTAMTRSSNFKYNKTVYCWYKNGYLYIPNITWEAIQVEGMWDGPVIGYCETDFKQCYKMQDKAFHVPDYLFAEIEQMVEQEFKTLGQIPSDGNDNSQNILR